MKRINIDEINEWPDSWAGFKKDVEYGQKLIQLMKPFIEELLQSECSYKTIKNHIDNLWVLGGYIIKEINNSQNKVDLEPHLLLTRYIDSIDGPWIYDFSESEQKGFDATCRKLYKYIVEKILRKIHNKPIRLF